MEFQAIAWHAEDVLEDEETSYTIKGFGRTMEGKSVAVTITNFAPFFYVKIKPEWESNATLTKIYKHLSNLTGDGVAIELVKRKDFWGFTNNKLFSFFKIEFPNLQRMKQTVTKLGKLQNISGLSKHKFELYESNFEPFIRFIHIRKLLPTGWIRITKFHNSTEILEANTDIDIQCHWKSVEPINDNTVTAPFLVASFDLECTSSGGEFPVPVKSHKHLSLQLYDIYNSLEEAAAAEYKQKETLVQCIKYALGFEKTCSYLISRVFTKKPLDKNNIHSIIEGAIDNIYAILRTKGQTMTKEHKIAKLSQYLHASEWLGPLEGDAIIQIGTTFHKYGSKDIFYKHIVTLGTCDPIEGVDVEAHTDEKSLLLAWRNMLVKMNPDIITGYNIFGFDFNYLYERAKELGIAGKFMELSRFKDRSCAYKEQNLSSSALGDNILKYISMEGRVLVDLMKVVQRDHKLDSYKLDNVAFHFTGDRKDDVSPKEIFELQKGSATDRAKVAAYCIQDCALCNHLMIKLEIVANNMGMSNVCLVPMEYIFMRGQGIKIFSLILNECRKEKFLIPNLKRSLSIRKETIDKALEGIAPEHHDKFNMDIKIIEKALRDETRLEGQMYSNSASAVLKTAAEMTGIVIDSNVKSLYPYANAKTVTELCLVVKEAINQVDDDSNNSDSYEGAIVLPPKQGIYIKNPVSVLDYASLYPSSMISENLSHDRMVIDPAYDNLPGVEYLDIKYDIFRPGTKEVIGERVCRFVQGEKGILPSILMKLLGARKATRKRMTHMQYNGNHIGNVRDNQLTTDDGTVIEIKDASLLKPAYNEFELAVMDGLQVAYKVTANSLYGQIGARTSPVYLKDIAACTTSTGRKMILLAKQFLEDNHGAEIVYGDTDSIFCIFPKVEAEGHAAIMPSIKIASLASKELKPLLKAPHDLEYEKTFWPFVLLSKKRYVGNVYEQNDKKFKQKSMGIVLKRRDNAGIVKELYGGIIDIILNKQDINLSIEFLKDGLNNLIKGKFPIETLVISKSLGANYKDPTKIAHKVLAERIAERDPGNKPQINDRIPYVYIKSDDAHVLQGDRIETPDFVKQNGLVPDYAFYITNQIMNPILQVYALEVEKLPGFETFPEDYLRNIRENLTNDLKTQEKIDDKFDEIKELVVKKILFDPVLAKIENTKLKKSLLIKKYYKNGSGILDPESKPKPKAKAGPKKPKKVVVC